MQRAVLVTQEQIDEFLRGKNLARFALGQTGQEIVKQKYVTDLQRSIPHFDTQNQQDVSRLQQRAAVLLEGLRRNKPQQMGLSPSLLGEIHWPTRKIQKEQSGKGKKQQKQFEDEIFVPSAYFVEKKRKQALKVHIDISGRAEVEKRLEAIQGSTDAANVRLFLYINGTLQLEVSSAIDEPPRHGNPFYNPFNLSTQEATISEHDTETRLLTNALAACRSNSQATEWEEEAHTYELALVGPHGACDGCKDRLRAFKVQWRQLFQRAHGARRLVITYFYTQKKSIQRSGTTVYGWDEALEKKLDPKQKDSATYYYRSMNSEVTP